MMVIIIEFLQIYLFDHTVYFIKTEIDRIKEIILPLSKKIIYIPDYQQYNLLMMFAPDVLTLLLFVVPLSLVQLCVIKKKN
jgi:hypothetical protein